MKKVLLVLTAMILMSGSAWGAVVSCTEGTVDITRGTGAYTSWDRGKIEKVAIDFVTGAADEGNVQGGANCSIPIHGYIYMVTLIPETGATALDTTMDVTLKDSDGHDTMSSNTASPQLTNLAVGNQQFSPLIGGSAMARWVEGNVEFWVFDGGNSNGGQIIIYVYRD